MAKTPKATTTPAAKAPGSHIVSSAHLVSPQSAEMSEFEFGLIVASNAFHRWVVHCMAAAGLKDLMPLDVLVLHHVTHRARDKRLSDICFIMNIEDTHLVNYSLKKLVSLGVVVSSKSGKEVTYAATEAGSDTRCSTASTRCRASAPLIPKKCSKGPLKVCNTVWRGFKAR